MCVLLSFFFFDMITKTAEKFLNGTFVTTLILGSVITMSSCSYAKCDIWIYNDTLQHVCGTVILEFSINGNALSLISVNPWSMN